jgi:hypothetical protein
MKSSITDLILRPDAFFAARMADPPDLKIPVLVVLVGAIISGLNGYFTAGVTATLMAGSLGGMAGMIQAIAAVAAFIGVFVLWVVLSALFFLIAKVFLGTGPFSRTAEMVGWGYFPQVVGSLVSLVLSLVYLPAVVVPRAVPTDPAAIQAAVQHMMADPSMQMLTITGTVVSVLFLVWSANLWIFGIRHARGLSLRDAAITILIPVGVYLILVVAGLLMGGALAWGM